MTEADDDLPGRAFDLALLRRLWPFVQPYRAAFAGSLGILALSFCIELLGPWLLRSSIQGPMSAPGLAPAERYTGLLWHASAFLGVVLLGSLCSFGYGRLTAWNGQRVVRDVRRKLFEALLAAPLSFHEKNAAGKLTTRVTSDVENLNELIATGVLQSSFDLLKILGVLAALFFLDVELALFTLSATPVVVVLSMLFRARAQRAYRAVRQRLARQNAYTAEAIAGIRTTRALLREDEVERRYAAHNDATSRAWRETVHHFSLFFALVDFALRATSIGLLWFGGQAVLAGQAEPGMFLQFWLYFGMLTAPIKELGEKYNVLQSAFASAERIFAILDVAPFPPPKAAYREPPPGPLAVEFRDVTFAYGEGAPALRKVSFAAARGTTLAVVGPTGAGKSTLLGLVSRLRDVDAGAVLVGGIDVRDWDPAALRRRVAVVAQDLFLFTGTVLDNLRLFDPSVSEERVWRALETVGAAEFVRTLPGGLRAPVEERGASFSQGQRQLLAFARALVVDPDVLVLDEATASIDSAAEQKLQQALALALRERTALVVAHRLSTVRDSGQILVLEHGAVLERGSHAQLLRDDGAYAAMVRACAEAAP